MQKKPWYVYHLLITIGLVALAFGFRMLSEPMETSLPYKTFFLAVPLTAIFAGFEAGLITVILSAFIVNTLANPHFSFAWQTLQTYSGPNLVFLINGLIACFAIEGIHLNSRRYDQELINKNKMYMTVKASTLRLKKIFDQFHTTVALLNPTKEIPEVKQATLTRKRNQDVIDRHFYDYPWWTDDPKVRAQVIEAIHAAKQGQSLRFDLPVKLGDTWIPMDLQISPVCDEEGNLTGIFTTVLDISLRQKAAADARIPAYHDSLTKLPNRQALIERLKLAIAYAKRSKSYGAVLFLGMDKLKILNDLRGQEHGDLLLIQVAERLNSSIREVDVVARFGGDEFVVLVENLHVIEANAYQKAVSVAEKIRASLDEHFEIKGDIHFSSPSIGICLFCGETATAEDLIKRAEIAMSAAKKAGGNAMRFYQET
jgi:diguanylate cyclase (GGDEF)-like protein